MKQMQKRTCMGIVLLILTLTMTACSTETIEPATSKFSTGSDNANTIPIVLQGHTATEVSEKLGITKQAVNQCKNRALKKLRNRL